MPNDHKNKHDITVTVRTPAGLGDEFELKDHDRVDKTTKTAVDHFVAKNQLAPGNYGLALVRDGVAKDLNAAGRLDDYDIVDGDVLQLFPKDAQVDG